MGSVMGSKNLIGIVVEAKDQVAKLTPTARFVSLRDGWLAPQPVLTQKATDRFVDPDPSEPRD